MPTNRAAGVNARKKTELADRRARVAALRLRGRTIMQIADEVDIGTQTVRTDIRAIEAMWREDTVRDTGDMKAQDLSRIEHMIDVCWESIELGNSNALWAIDRVQKLLERRAAIAGYDAPRRTINENKNDTKLSQNPADLADWSEYTEEELAAIIEIRQRALERASKKTEA